MEKHLQCQCEDYLNLLNILFLHLKTSITRKINNKFLTFPVETNKGFPDLFIFLEDKNCFFVELKYGKNNLDNSQKEKKEKLEMLGFNYYVVYDFNEFKKIIENEKNG